MKTILLFIKDHTTLLLAISSIYIYFCVYGYELSYLKAFNIPSNFVTIDFITVFLDCHYIIDILLRIGATFGLARILFVYFAKKSAKAARIIKWSMLVAITTIFVTIFGESSQIIEKYALYILLVIESIVVVLCLILPIEPFEHQSENGNVEDRGDIKSEFTKLIKSLTYTLLFILALFAFVIVNSLGSGQANHQVEFQVIDSTNYVVVRKYGDQLLCVDYDTTKMIVGSKVSLIKLYSNKPVYMTTKKLGRIADVSGQTEKYEEKLSKQLKSKSKNVVPIKH